MKILLNGCSMVAGDGITWPTYFPDIEWLDIARYSKTKPHPKYSQQEIWDFIDQYKTTLRKQDNLGANLAKILNLEVIDLSEDGKSNDSIVHETVAFLNNLSRSARKEFYVCVGWTAYERRKIYSNDRFYDVTHSTLKSTAHRHAHDFVKHAIVDVSFINHAVNYLHSVAYLQSYLQNIGLNYVFWRSLHSGIHFPVDQLIFNTENMFDATRWLKFDDKLPWLGKTWMEHLWLNPKTDFISDKNYHPSLTAIKTMARRIADQISGEAATAQLRKQ